MDEILRDATMKVVQVDGETMADEYVNDPSMEIAWAMKAHEHARIHMNLLQAIDPCALRLSRIDDEIYAKFRCDFSNFPLELIPESMLKSIEYKTKWRQFAEHFKDKYDDYNFGTLLRLDASGVYDSDNTILVTKIQFLAIEIARNRDGVNKKYRHLIIAHKDDES